jgi:rod shape-determining protein MreD
LLTPSVKYISALIISILIQKSFIWLISISQYNISPDIPIIILILIGLKRGKLEATIIGFFAGLLVDILSGTFLGLSTLVYSIIGFISGYFNKDDGKYLKKYYFAVIVFILALTGNVIYFFIYFQSYSLFFAEVLLKYVFPNSTYTAIISLVYVVFPKKRESSIVY